MVLADGKLYAINQGGNHQPCKLDGDKLAGQLSGNFGGQEQTFDLVFQRQPLPLANFAGTWKYAFGEAGNEFIFKLEKDGETVSGTVKWLANAPVPIAEAKVAKDELSFSFQRVRSTGEKVTNKFGGKLESEKLKGKISGNCGGEDQTVEVEFERQKQGS